VAKLVFLNIIGLQKESGYEAGLRISVGTTLVYWMWGSGVTWQHLLGHKTYLKGCGNISLH